jgi:hypothetical protein
MTGGDADCALETVQLPNVGVLCFGARENDGEAECVLVHGTPQRSHVNELAAYAKTPAAPERDCSAPCAYTQPAYTAMTPPPAAPGPDGMYGGVM